MLTVTITSAVQYIMKDDDWEWLQQHLNTPLQVLSLSYMHDDGQLWCISVYRDLDDGDFTCVTLFVEQNELIFRLDGDIQ